MYLEIKQFVKKKRNFVQRDENVLNFETFQVKKVQDPENCTLISSFVNFDAVE